MTNQYKAATELQSCIVPTDFRILRMNMTRLSAAAGRGVKRREPCPTCIGAWEQWAMQTQSRSLSGQQGPGWSLTEGPVYSNNSTRPGCQSRGKAPGARIHTQPPSAPYLPSEPGLGGAGQGGKAASEPSWAGRLNSTGARSLSHLLHSPLEPSTLLQSPAQDPSSRKRFQVLSWPVSRPIPARSCPGY